MRELNNVEIENISGAGLFGNIGAALGKAVGTLADWSNSIQHGGKAPVASMAAPTSTFFYGIGLMFDAVQSLKLADVTEALQATGTGVVQVVQAGLANKTGIG